MPLSRRVIIQYNGGGEGANGLSAYQVAVANGFVGTEQQWLASLRAVIPNFSIGNVYVVEAIPEVSLTGSYPSFKFNFGLPSGSGGGNGGGGGGIQPLTINRSFSTVNDANGFLNPPTVIDGVGVQFDGQQSLEFPSLVKPSTNYRVELLVDISEDVDQYIAGMWYGSGAASSLWKIEYSSGASGLNFTHKDFSSSSWGALENPAEPFTTLPIGNLENVKIVIQQQDGLFSVNVNDGAETDSAFICPVHRLSVAPLRVGFTQGTEGETPTDLDGATFFTGILKSVKIDESFFVYPITTLEPLDSIALPIGMIGVSLTNNEDMNGVPFTAIEGVTIGSTPGDPGLGTSYQFDNGYIQLQIPPFRWYLHSPFFITGRFRFNDDRDTALWSQSNADYGIKVKNIISESKLQVTIKRGQGVEPLVLETASLSTNAWHLVQLSHSGNDWKLWVNNVLADSAVAQIGYNAIDIPFLIGEEDVDTISSGASMNVIDFLVRRGVGLVDDDDKDIIYQNV